MFPNHIASADAVPSNTAAAVATGSVVTDLTSTTEVGGGDNHNNSSTGFDLINHAIRMGGGGGGGVSSSALDEMAVVARRSNELLSMKARLLQRQGSVVPITTTNNHHHNNHYNSSSAVAAAAANRVQHHQQLQAQQQQQLQAQLQHHQQQLASATVRGAGNSGGIGAGIDDGDIVAALRNQHNLPLPTPQKQHNEEQHKQGQHEQNARQLNPNAFQFPWKLHDMLDRSFSEGYGDVVSWVDDGQAFRVHNAEVFVDHIMQRFFKQTKYKSVRCVKCNCNCIIQCHMNRRIWHHIMIHRGKTDNLLITSFFSSLSSLFFVNSFNVNSICTALTVFKMETVKVVTSTSFSDEGNELCVSSLQDVLFVIRMKRIVPMILNNWPDHIQLLIVKVVVTTSLSLIMMEIMLISITTSTLIICRMIL
jgi:hypothetical protein